MRTTPGKWLRLRQQGGQIAGHRWVAVVAESETGVVRSICDMDKCSAPGDVALIVAAPELLEAVQALLSVMDSGAYEERKAAQEFAQNAAKKATDGT